MMLQSADDISAKMRQVRVDLHDDMDNVVESAREMTDWKTYVHRYPWVCLGAAAAIGYLVIPAKVRVVSPDPKALLKLAKDNKLVVDADPTPKASSGIAGALFGFVANAATRAAIAYVSQQAGKYVGAHAGEKS